MGHTRQGPKARNPGSHDVGAFDKVLILVARKGVSPLLVHSHPDSVEHDQDNGVTAFDGEVEIEMAAENQSPFIVRHATIQDVDALQAFIEPFVVKGRLLPRTQDELEDLTQNGFLAIADGQIVGFAALEIYSSKLAELRSLAVSSDFQGRGIGRELVQACVDLARKQHVFEVMAITSADEFFQRCGFDFTLPGEKKAVFLQTRDSY